MHALDMIVCAYPPLSDVAEFVPSAAEGLRVEVRAHYRGFNARRFSEFFTPIADKLSSFFGVNGTLFLTKRVPLGAGIGGSSACVVAAIRAIEESLKASDKTADVPIDFLLSLGSDVPAMYAGGCCRVRGVGEDVQALPCPPLSIDLHIAKGGCDSAACYAMYDLLNAENAISHGDIPTSVQEAVALCRNDLSPAAERLNPRIARLTRKLSKKEEHVVMSGSGSAVAVVKILK